MFKGEYQVNQLQRATTALHARSMQNSCKTAHSFISLQGSASAVCVGRNVCRTDTPCTMYIPLLMHACFVRVCT